MKTIGAATADGAQLLAGAGIEQARTETASLMSYVLGRDRTFILAHSEQVLTENQLHTFRQCVDRRAAGEPLQYITGHQEFFKLDFEVTPDVLIPRPETEIIVEAALDLIRDDPSPFIIDVGTGSGCIIISLLHELPGAKGLATDISVDALRVARRNAERHNVSSRLELVQSDCFVSLPETTPASLIVSNPPYIPADEVPHLQREVRDHEPLAALVSGSEGLSHIERLIQDSPAFLEKGAYFVFEIGFGQIDALEDLIDSEVWDLIEVKSDLQNIPRTLVLRKK